MVTVDQVTALARSLPRSAEAWVYGRLKFRIGRIVYLAFSHDQTLLGFAFPKEERSAGRDYPEKFMLPTGSDLRFNWVIVRLDAIEPPRCTSSCSTPGMVVPKRVAASTSRPRPGT